MGSSVPVAARIGHHVARGSRELGAVETLRLVIHFSNDDFGAAVRGHPLQRGRLKATVIHRRHGVAIASHLPNGIVWVSRVFRARVAVQVTRLRRGQLKAEQIDLHIYFGTAERVIHLDPLISHLHLLRCTRFACW